MIQFLLAPLLKPVVRLAALSIGVALVMTLLGFDPYALVEAWVGEQLIPF